MQDRKALDPNMPAQELRLHMGELTASEVRTARAAIAWANSAQERDGWVLVPRKPSEKMAIAGEDIQKQPFAESAIRIYKAMIAAVDGEK